jgi:hypothetical protein
MFQRPLPTALILLTLASGIASAQRHPHYLRARSDLFVAQRILTSMNEEPNVMRSIRNCEQEVAAAIREIDNAAVLDGRDLRQNPPIDANLDRPGRFRKVMELIESARAGLGREEDNPAAARWRNRAYRHLDLARDYLRTAASTARLDRLWH